MKVFVEIWSGWRAKPRVGPPEPTRFASLIFLLSVNYHGTPLQRASHEGN